MFAFRGTRLTKAGTVAADLELLKDRDAELYYSARALRHVRRHVRRLQAAAPAVQWAFITTGAPRGVKISGRSMYRVQAASPRRAVGLPSPLVRCGASIGAGPDIMDKQSLTLFLFL